jgi:hypothetical protein
MKNVLRFLRKTYFFFNNKSSRSFNRENIINDPNKASDIIYNALMSDNPLMVGRFGANELNCLTNYLSIKSKKKDFIKYITGEIQAWWWVDGIIENLYNVAGFYPTEKSQLKKFCNLMICDAHELDIIGSWLEQENIFKDILLSKPKIWIDFLTPFFSEKPWTKALEGKNVLVVHPFAKTIESQYLKKDLLFKNEILPSFNLKTIKAVQTVAGNKSEFDTWFDALDYMKSEIDKVDYDICLIGCGAYGFPLAAHVKRNGKKSIHLGGSLQLLFGIRGKRWENPNLNKDYSFFDLMNEHWVRPSIEETPQNSVKVEGATYW